MDIRKSLIVAVPLLMLVTFLVAAWNDRDAPAEVPSARDAQVEPAPAAASAAEAPSDAVTAPAGDAATAGDVAPATPAIGPHTEPINMAPPVAPVDAASATVNGALITVADVEAELARILISPAAHGEMDEARRLELRAKALDELIVRELAYQRAKASGITVSPREVKAAATRVRQRYASAEAFAEALEAEGISERDLEGRIERELVIEKFYRIEITQKARVSDRDVRQHYQKNVDKYRMPESLHLWAISIDVTPETEATAKQRVDEAFADLKRGIEFAAVAYKFSDDDYSVVGGDYKTVHRGHLAADLEPFVFAAREGELAGPVRAGASWYIIRVADKRPERLIPYADVREKLTKMLTAARLEERRAQLLEQLRSAARIEYIAANATEDGLRRDAAGIR
jgi:parvulin-like peptidyl-prolyl isomerase